MTNKTNYRIILLLGLLLLTAATISSSSAANTIFVNNATGNDSHNGLTAATAKATIQNGTDTVKPDGTVNVADGIYKESVVINKNVTLLGQSQSGTIIDGYDTLRPLTITSGTVTIINFTIQNGISTDGGGINNIGDLTITDTTIKDNTANSTGEDVYGGGIYNEGTLTINNSTITNNTATATNGNAYGGGIYNSGTLIIHNNTITNNTATTTDGYADGGGISNEYGTLTIHNSTITNNIAIGTNNAYGGGISHSFLGNLTINNSIITNNTATAIGGDVYGGGISNWGAFLTINNSTITGNTATATNGNAYGGGISNNGDLTITDTTIKDNIAIGTNNVYGGGIYNRGTLTVVNCSIENNNAGDGGGIFNWYGNLKVISSTLTNNTASMEGNAISNYGPAENNIPVELHFNRITGNGEYTLYSNSNMLNATDNWWGSNNPNFSTIISGVVNYTPWLYLTFTAAPLSIQQGSTSTLTASFNQVFDGTTITQIDPVLGHIPDGTPVTFTTDLGNVGSKSVVKYTLNGIATAILRADEAAGSALVSVFADSQTPLTRTVTITPVANAATSTSVQAANTIGMQTTGAPIVPLAIAVLSILGGLVANRRK